MRLLAFSDIHRDRDRAERLVELAQDADVVVGAGDCATMHNGLETTIEVLSEDEAAAKLESCPEGAALVVHSPPMGYVDEVHGRHLGSRSILEAIERKRPALALCGHVHQCWGGEAAIGTTPVVNLGPEGRFFDI